MSEFKFTGRGNKIWDTTSLAKVLKRDFAGVGSLKEAVAMARNKTPQTETNPPATGVPVTKEDPLALAWKIASLAQIDAMRANPDFIATPEMRQQMKAMPITTEEEIKLWGESCVKLIRGDTKT